MSTAEPTIHESAAKVTIRAFTLTLLIRRAIEISLVVALMSWIWALVAVSREAPTRTDPTPSQAYGHRTQHPADAVAERHLFGADAQDVQSSPRAEAQVEIAGIVAADREQDSVALLAIDGEVRPYQIDQTLPDGESVEHIEAAAVVLKNAGLTRRIEMTIKYADSNAIFRKAAMQGGDGSSWADAYLDDSHEQPPTGPVHGTAGILNVAAANASHAPGISLRAIREERAARFSRFRANKGAPPSPAADDGNQ